MKRRGSVINYLVKVSKVLITHILNDFNTVGQSNKLKVCYEIKEGVMIATDIRKKGKREGEKEEFTFMYVLAILSILLFGCGFLYVPLLGETYSFSLSNIFSLSGLLFFGIFLCLRYY